MSVKNVDAYWLSTSIPIKIYRKLRSYYRRRFQNYVHVFENKGPFKADVNAPCKIVSFYNYDNIPNHIIEAISNLGGDKSLLAAKFEIEHGATMWIGIVDGDFAHYRFTRYGRDFKNWFININNNDIVFFRAKTHPKYRGRGIHGAVARHVMHSLLDKGDKAYVDCSIHNVSSIRANSKAGFKKVATMKPISRRYALGADR